MPDTPTRPGDPEFYDGSIPVDRSDGSWVGSSPWSSPPAARPADAPHPAPSGLPGGMPGSQVPPPAPAEPPLPSGWNQPGYPPAGGYPASHPAGEPATSEQPAVPYRPEPYQPSAGPHPSGVAPVAWWQGEEDPHAPPPTHGTAAPDRTVDGQAYRSAYTAQSYGPPVYGQPVHGQPVYGQPVHGSGSTGREPSNAVVPYVAAPALPVPRPGPDPVAPLSAPPAPVRHRRRGPLLALVALVLVALIGGGSWAAVTFVGGDDDEGSAAACAGDTTLDLVVAPDIEPVVRAAVDAVAPTPAGAQCPVVAVAAQQPADTLAQRAAAAKRYDGWVPSSTVWLRQGAAEQTGFAATGPLLARTPVVVAMPKPYAEKLGWPAKQPAWAEIAALTYSRQIPKFSMPDPTRDTTGMLATLAVFGALARRTPDAGIAQLQALTLRSRLADAAADPRALLGKMAAQSDPNQAVAAVGLFPVTEQALWAYSREAHETELVAAYPPDALPEAEFPLALTTAAAADPARKDLADRLVAWFAGPDGAAALANNGLRGPQGRDATGVAPAGPGFVARYPQPFAPPTDPAAVRTAVDTWAQYKRLQFQVLVLIDASGSMNEPVQDRSGRLTTKAELLQKAGAQATQLFGEDTSVGMWVFGTPTPQSPPYVEAIPFGPLDENLGGQPRRKRLAEAAGGYRAFPTAGTPLYETILRANEEMERRWTPEAVTMVVVLTDGLDRDSPYTMPKADFMAKLAAARDPDKPLPINSIAYGADADLPTLDELAKVTGGVAAPSTDPADLASAMARIFLAARQTRR